MSVVSTKIKQKMEEQGLTAYSLNKKANLNSSGVQNILYGRSKNPTVEVLSSIAKALKCSISELVDETIKAPVILKKYNNWNKNLYLECLNYVSSILLKEGYPTELDDIFILVDEIYEYSLKNHESKLSKKFSEWVISKKFENP